KAKRDEPRERVRPEILGFINAYIEGRVDLAELRSVFDVRTRTEWDLFGLKGPSGAMFLNTLVKHVPDQREATEQLRAALRFPDNETLARERLQAFHDYLRGMINAGIVTRRQVQPSRAPFFVGAAWHMHAPEAWPIFYDSAKRVLEKEELYVPNDDPVRSYFEFREAFLSLDRALGTSRWELEHLCVRLDAREAAQIGPKPEPPTAPPPGSRVWLIAPGPNADHWDEFYDAGIVAIGWEALGDLSQYPTLETIKDALRKHRTDGTEPTQDALACWEFAKEMRPGDLVFAKKGRSSI